MPRRGKEGLLFGNKALRVLAAGAALTAVSLVDQAPAGANQVKGICAPTLYEKDGRVSVDPTTDSELHVFAVNDGANKSDAKDVKNHPKLFPQELKETIGISATQSCVELDLNLECGELVQLELTKPGLGKTILKDGILVYVEAGEAVQEDKVFHGLIVEGECSRDELARTGSEVTNLSLAGAALLATGGVTLLASKSPRVNQ